MKIRRRKHTKPTRHQERWVLTFTEVRNPRLPCFRWTSDGYCELLMPYTPAGVTEFRVNLYSSEPACQPE